MTSTFSLPSALGWLDLNGSPIALNPIIAMSESPGIASDLLHSLIISQLLSRGHTVCVIGVKYPFTHIKAICKKVGPINLDQHTQSGDLLYIDCLNPYHQNLSTTPSLTNSDDTLLKSQNEKHQNLNTMVSYQALLEKAQSAYNFHSVQRQHEPRPFSICIDDLSMLMALNSDQPHPTKPIDFLTNLLHLTNPTLLSPQQQFDASSLSPNQSTWGSLSFSLAANTTTISTNPSHPSVLFKAPHPTSLIFPNHNLMDKDARSHSTFDIPINNGGDTSHILHWVSNLNYHLRSASTKGDAPNNTVLIIELSSLVSGYSKDIYCQLSVFAPPNTTLLPINDISGTSTRPTINILYLVVGSTGALMCHARA